MCTVFWYIYDSLMLDNRIFIKTLPRCFQIIHNNLSFFFFIWLHPHLLLRHLKSLIFLNIHITSLIYIMILNFTALLWLDIMLIPNIWLSVQHLNLFFLVSFNLIFEFINLVFLVVFNFCGSVAYGPFQVAASGQVTAYG